MNPKSRLTRILSSLLVLALLIGVIPFTMGAGFGEDDLDFRSSDIAEKGLGDSLLDGEGYKLEKLDPSLVDLAGVRDLPTQGVDLRSAALKSSDLKGKYTDEELTYVEAYADMLTDPIGIVDLEGEDDEVFYVFVWLQDLPKPLEEAYAHRGARNRDYERVREDGRRARSDIRTRGRHGGNSIEITWEYSVVFSGFALEATLADLAQIAAMPGVFAITEVTYYSMDYIPDPEYTTPGNVGAREVMDIADLHAAGIDGTGVKVGVIDAGIQHDHPDLVGALKGGYNFAPRGTRNTGGRSPDLSTPDGNHGTHVSGTIASQGITSLGVAPGCDLYMAQVFSPDNTNSAATADVTAALEWYSGGTPGTAYANLPAIPGGRMDVINMSLGNNANTAYEAGHVARNNAVLAGVVLVNSAGNNAYATGNTTNRNNYSLGSGGVSLPISVAASQYGGNPILSYKPSVNGGNPFEVYIENGDATLSGVLRNGSFGSTEPRSVPFTPAAADIAFGPYPGSPFTIQPLVFVPGLGYEIYYACAGNNPHILGLGAGTDMTTAEMNALQAMAPGSLTGKILVVNRGQNFLDYKGQALRLGAAGLIIINRDPTVIGNLNIGSDTSAKDLMIFSAPNSVKEVMFDAAQSGVPVYLNPGALNKLGHALQPADFSSIGPVNETAEIKPDVTAPGWSILSTDLRSGYTAMSGTSMSSPWVAGVAALVIQAHPDDSPAEIKARIMNTSDPELIKPFAGRLNNAGGYYFNSGGTESSVFEQGSGFVNPKRAVLDDVFIIVTSQNIPTGHTDRRTFEDAQMASFSFGHQGIGDEDGPAITDKLTATINGGVAKSVRVVYNHDTRYSNKNLDFDVLVHFENKGATVDVWLEISEDASIDQVAGNLYEGYIYITVGDDEFVLPWACRTGEAPGSDFWLLYPDRPVQAIYNVAAAQQDFAPYSAQNMIYFMFEGKQRADSIALRRSGNNYIMDIYMIGYNADGDPTLNYRIPITVGTSAATGLKLSDFIELGETYFIRFDGRGNTQLVFLGIPLGWNTSLTNVAAGGYNLSFLYDDMYRWYQYNGIVFTNTRPVLTVESSTITANTVTDHAYGFGTDEVTVKGRMFSAAVQRAADLEFMWCGAYAFFFDEIYPVDQSLNVLVDAVTGWELLFPNEDFGGEEVPWFADEDGFFELTLPVQEDGYFFPEDICPSGVTYVADAFDVSFPWDAQYVYEPMLYGAMRSFQWQPMTFEDDPEIEVISATLNNVAGLLTAEFLFQDGEIPEELDMDLLSAVLTVDGEEDDVLVFEGYDADTGIATWTFAPYKVASFTALELEAIVTYEQFWITTSASDTDVSIHLVNAALDALVDKLNGNKNGLHLWVRETYSDGTAGEDYYAYFLIDNNAEGNYKVGPYTIYCNTKGNTQIRDLKAIIVP